MAGAASPAQHPFRSDRFAEDERYGVCTGERSGERSRAMEVYGCRLNVPLSRDSSPVFRRADVKFSLSGHKLPFSHLTPKRYNPSSGVFHIWAVP